MYEVGNSWKTRSDLLVTILKLTPQCRYKAVGYFEIRGVRIRVFYDGKGDEFFGEKGLDLMKRLPVGSDPTIKGKRL